MGVRIPALGNKRYIYFFKSCTSGYVKIGISKDVKRRFREVSAMSPEELYIVGVIEEDAIEGYSGEKYAHHYFGLFRKHGEWFDIPQTSLIVDYIEERGGVVFAYDLLVGDMIEPEG